MGVSSKCVKLWVHIVFQSYWTKCFSLGRCLFVLQIQSKCYVNVQRSFFFFFVFLFFFFVKDVEKFEGTFGSSKKLHPEVFQCPHMVTVFTQVLANLLLWSRFSFERPGRPLQPCEGPFLEVFPTELAPFHSLLMRGRLFSTTGWPHLSFGIWDQHLCTAPTHDPYEVLEPPQKAITLHHFTKKGKIW